MKFVKFLTISILENSCERLLLKKVSSLKENGQLNTDHKLKVLWLIPDNFYPIFESSNISTEKNKYLNNNLPRQYDFDGSNYGGNSAP